MKTRPWTALALFILLSLSVSVIGGWVTSSSVGTWYARLNKPAWNPPNWIFGPVWTLLYAMMAFVGWRLWCRREANPAIGPALTGFFVQMFFNFLWSMLFFGLRAPGTALIDIALLLIAIVWMNLRLLRIDRTLALLWMPYVLWVSFATALNFWIWRHN